MAYDEDSVLDSEMAYRTLRVLQLEGESYPRQISKEIDAHASSVSNILKAMREEGIVERGKRTKAQYYNLNRDGLLDLHERLFEQLKHDADENHQTHDGESFVRVDFPDGQKQRFEDFFFHYLEIYFGSVPGTEQGATLRDMLVNDFGTDLFVLLEGMEQDRPDWVDILENKLRAYLLSRPRARGIAKTAYSEM